MTPADGYEPADPLNNADVVEQLIAKLQTQPGAADMLASIVSQRIGAHMMQRAAPRILAAGADVYQNAAGTALWYPGGPSRFPILNFGTGLRASINSKDNLNQVDISANGGADCLFDHLVSPSCWATEVAAGRGTEGQTFTTASGCTYRMWSTVQGAWTAAALLSGNYTIALCSGNAGALAMGADQGDTANKLTIVGVGNGSTITGGAAAAGVTIAAGGGRAVRFERVNLVAGSGSVYSVNRTGGSQTIEFYNASCANQVLLQSGAVAAWDSNFSGAIDMLGNSYHSTYMDCFFGATVKPGTETYLQDCTSDFTGGIGVDASGTNSSANLRGHIFRSGGGAYTYYVKVGAYANLNVQSCFAAVGATAAILIDSSYNYSGADALVVGNKWGCTLGMDIQSGSMASLLYIGNTHGHQGGAAFTAVQTSGAGNVANGVFAANGPSGAKYAVTGSNNRYEGVLATTAAPTLAANEGTFAFDRTANTLYVNTDGSTTWAIVGVAGSGGAAPNPHNLVSVYHDGEQDYTNTLNLLGLAVATGDLTMYSDLGITQVAQWDGATGHIGIGIAPALGSAIGINKAVNSTSAHAINAIITTTSGGQPSAVLFSLTENATSGTLTSAGGSTGSMEHGGLGVTITDFYGYRVLLDSVAGTGAITRAMGLWVPAASWGAGVIPVTTHVLRAEDQGNASTTTAYGLKIAAQTGGAKRSFIADGLALGTDAALKGLLDVYGHVAILTDNAVRLYDSDNSNYIGLRADSARSTDITYVLSATDPTASQVLSAGAPSAGVSTLSWVTPTAFPRQWIWAPDAAPAAVITSTADAQGNIYHSGPGGFTAVTLYVDAETAPGASGLPITVAYGDTNDLDTVASWTTIATYTLSSEKSNKTTSMTNAAVPANRLMRMTVGTIVGSPADATICLEGTCP